MASKIPGQIGPYTLHEEIGRGGMSVVFRAHDSRSNNTVALKVLPMELAYNNTFLGRFLREGENALRLQHSNIVRVYEADQHEGHHFIAMEWATGGTLSERIRRRQGPLPLDETVRILQQIAAGLDYAHNLGFLHRDIKPSNIMFAGDEPPGDGRALITDFGVAKNLTSEHTMVTMPGFSVGTPAYMSPEQARGDLDIDRRSDIYSLGVVAYAMLTGRLPFDADSQLVLLRKIVDEMPTPPESANPQIHPGAAYVLKCVLAKDPDARYPTAGEFVYALGQSVGAQGMDATVPMLPSALAGGPRPPGQTPVAPPSYGGRPVRSSPPVPPPYAPAQPVAASSGRGKRVGLALAAGVAGLALVAFAFINGNLTFRPNAAAPAVAPVSAEATAATTTPVADQMAEPAASPVVPVAMAAAPAAEATAPPVEPSPPPTTAETATPESPAPAAESVSLATVTLEQPAAAAQLSGAAEAVRFAWHSAEPPVPGQGLELVFWPQSAGEQGWQTGRSPSGLRRSSPTGEQWEVLVHLATFARTQTDGFLHEGDYFWGVVQSDVAPYARRALVGEPRAFTYTPGDLSLTAASGELICSGECTRD